MENLVRALEARRDTLLRRGAELAEVTRDRGLDALGRVRDGALDWHETLRAWRQQLEGRDARLARLQARVLRRFDLAVVAFGERVRAEIDRLGRLELSAAPRDAELSALPGDAEAAEASEPKSAKAQPAKPKAAKTEANETTKPEAAKATKTKAAKPTKAKAAKAKSAKAKATEAKAKPNGARKPSTRLVMPIADYDRLTAKEILAELPRLTDAQCRTVLAHEEAHKGRKTVLKALRSRVSS